MGDHRGKVEVHRFHKDGTLDKIIDCDHNDLLNGFYLQVAEMLLFYPVPAIPVPLDGWQYPYANEIQFGLGNAETLPSDSTLSVPLESMFTPIITYPAAATVLFSTYITDAEGYNGLTIREAGLWSYNGMLMARILIGGDDGLEIDTDNYIYGIKWTLTG